MSEHAHSAMEEIGQNDDGEENPGPSDRNGPALAATTSELPGSLKDTTMSGSSETRFVLSGHSPDRPESSKVPMPSKIGRQRPVGESDDSFEQAEQSWAGKGRLAPIEPHNYRRPGMTSSVSNIPSGTAQIQDNDTSSPNPRAQKPQSGRSRSDGLLRTGDHALNRPHAPPRSSTTADTFAHPRRQSHRPPAPGVRFENFENEYYDQRREADYSSFGAGTQSRVPPGALAPWYNYSDDYRDRFHVHRPSVYTPHFQDYPRQATYGAAGWPDSNVSSWQPPFFPTDPQDGFVQQPETRSSEKMKLEKRIEQLSQELEEYRLKENKEAEVRSLKRDEEKIREKLDTVLRETSEDKRLASEKLILEEKIQKAENEARIQVELRLRAEQQAKQQEFERIERLKLEIRASIEEEIRQNQERRLKEEEENIRAKERIRAELLAEKREHEEFLAREDVRKQEVERRIERQYEEKRYREAELLRYKELTEMKLKIESDKIMEEERRKYELHRLSLDLRQEMIEKQLDGSSKDGHGDNGFNALDFIETKAPTATERDIYTQPSRNWHSIPHHTPGNPSHLPQSFSQEWDDPEYRNGTWRSVWNSGFHPGTQTTRHEIPQTDRPVQSESTYPFESHRQWRSYLSQPDVDSQVPLRSRNPLSSKLQMPQPLYQRSPPEVLQEHIRKENESTGRLSSDLVETPASTELFGADSQIKTNMFEADRKPTNPSGAIPAKERSQRLNVRVQSASDDHLNPPRNTQPLHGASPWRPRHLSSVALNGPTQQAVQTDQFRMSAPPATSHFFSL
ncbi:hypothetical protein E8E14_014696 [Neopestalotiopsis sp. 37M]|nr:hypothetical protein E8E14_014696 [Neopestalotiopsis sp. 37M]